MRTHSILFFLIALAISGCVPVSLNPVYDSENLVSFKNITGNWSDDGSDTYFITLSEDDSLLYFLDYTVDSSEYLNYCESRFELRFSKIGKHYYADCYPDFRDENEFKNWPLTAHMLGVHSFYRMKLENDTLRFWRMETESFESWLKKRPEIFPYQFFKDQDKLLLTASTFEIRNFLLEYEDNLDSLFTDMVELERINENQ